MYLPISHLPSKVLRAPVKDITFPIKKPIHRLISDMLDTVKKADGIGLAAPQIGKSLNLALVYLEDQGIPPFPLFNPKILDYGKQQVEIEEGCLSMPGVFGMVKRPKKIKLQAQDYEGKFITIEDDGWLARVMQHEFDHLHETLIIDKFTKITRGKELLSKYGLT